MSVDPGARSFNGRSASKRRLGAAALAAGMAALLVAAAPAIGTELAGSWSQHSAGQELVLVPKIKLQPNVGVTTGTSLGGSAGYGSMTRTTVVTEPTILDVERDMSLEIAEDGAFSWTTITSHAEGADCTRTTRREKTGRVRADGATLIFSVAGGTESFEKSCGGSGSGAIAPATESYSVSLDDGRMQLGDGTATWVFSRR